jgi:glycine hydroxymethyltransferase
MFMVDVRSVDEDLTGKVAATLLDDMGITLNRNAIPYDPRSPFVTSGIRIGTAAVTTAGMKDAEMVVLGRTIVEILRQRDNQAALDQPAGTVAELAAAFPSYPSDFDGYV